MMCSMSQHRTSHAFSLIELLVVLAIVAALLGLLLPTLSRTREAARDVHCRANLRSMMLIWAQVLQNTDGRILETRWNRDPHWIDAGMEKVVASRSWARPRPFDCPSVRHRVPEVDYPRSPWAYAVNHIWMDYDDSNAGKRWIEIRRPAQYPWFADVEVLSDNAGPSTQHVPRHRSPNSFFDFGVGANHGNLDRANIAFADFSQRSVAMSEIHANVSGGNRYEWFENR